MTSAAPRNPADSAAGPARREGFDGLGSAARHCLTCDREPVAEQVMTAVLVELPRRGASGGMEFQRLNYCPDCWLRSPWAGGANVLLDEGQSTATTDLFGATPVAIWSARVTPREKKKRTFVDDSVLMNFFLRLADDAEPVRQQFRFVLMLILLRHRKLRHEGIDRAADKREPDAWLVRLMPAMATATSTDPEQMHRVLDPRMNDSQIEQVAQQLSQILQEDLDDAGGPG
ncbi:MAG: hypothetical protein PHU85_02940 [Phycisphaerae bacterium]|nr:hypothetical protein [Phycisphaerae bacterium]